MNSAMRGAHALALAFACAAGSAMAQSARDAAAVLSRAYAATQSLSYTGTFVFQHGGRSETSRITRRASATGDIERLEILDGTPREVIRTQDGVRCFLPQAQTVKIGHRDATRSFPALLPAQLDELLHHYTVQLGPLDRVAGRACQSVALQPKDDVRYGYALCADEASGLLLRAITLSETDVPVEQFTFTQLSIGEVRPEAVEPQPATRSWRVEEASVRPADLKAEGWRIDSDLPGFQKIVEVVRVSEARKPIRQVVFSDGLAAVSVFIESARGRPEPMMRGAVNMGGINIYVREVEDYVVTVVGETPAASVRRLAEQVRYQRPQ
jgi:sigma-E factor negative regulatory protein RseB